MQAVILENLQFKEQKVSEKLVSSGATQGALWGKKTTSLHHEKFIKSFGQPLQISKAGCIPVIAAISGLHSHILFTQTEWKTVYKPLNSPKGLLKSAKMSTSLGAGVLKATSGPCNRRARWGRSGLLTLPGTGGELEPEQRADITRLWIGWGFTAFMSNRPWLDSCE